eukprot:scaffold61817_cov89-Cyclotella_meneghiniana.AAC.2
MKDLPKPYSAYTIFFRLERMYIHQQNGYIDNEIRAAYDPDHYDPVEHPRPSKYAKLVLPPYWYSSIHRKEYEKKRVHRKQEGSMSKSELTAMISKRWREVDIETSQYCKKLSNAEKLRRSLESSCEGSASNAISSGASESTAVTSDDSTTLTSTISLIPTPIARSSKVDAEIDATLDDSSLELFETNSLEFNFSGGAV